MSRPPLVDTHCHLDEESFDIDRDDAVERARRDGMVAIVSIGTTLKSSEAAVELAARFAPMVWAAVGLHPNYVSTAGPYDWDTIVRLAGAPRVVALGETGLDKYWDHSPLDLQREFFRRHLALSRETGLPFVVHCREAWPEVIEELTRAATDGPLRGVLHSFTGDEAQARFCLDLGLHISFAGMVTFKKSGPLRDVAASIPEDRLLVETDAPYLAPAPHRGKRNEPAWTRKTLECLAELRGVDPARLAEQTTANARRLFGLGQADSSGGS
jgi:TatD DNase family protein